MIIQIIGHSGSGKSAIADAVRERTNGIHLNDKDIISILNNKTNIVESSRIIGELARLLERIQDKPIIVDIECPTKESRESFGDSDAIIWIDTIKDKTINDWQDPEKYDHRVVVTGDTHEDALATRAITIIRKFGMLDWKERTTLILGKHQRWNLENRKMFNMIKHKSNQIVIGVKHVVGMSSADQLHFEQIKNVINSEGEELNIIKMPNIVSIVYTNDSDYQIIKLEQENK